MMADSKRFFSARGVTRLLAALGASLLVLGCSSDRPKPTPLEPLQPRLAVRQAWSTSVGGISFPMAPVARDGQVILAGDDGSVMALDVETGQTVWRGDAGGRLTAGVGSDGRLAAVVTRDNEVVTLDRGKPLWRQRVPARVVTPPLVAGERVFVLGVDRVVHAFDALDGRRLWTYQRPGDALTLAQPGVLAAARNQLIVGQGARLVALDGLRGTVAWDVLLGTPRGSNEVERLADLVGPAVRRGNNLCVRAFQNAVGCVDLERQALVWSRNTAGATAVGASADRLFGGDANDRLTAWSLSNGDTAWTQEKLLYRGLSGAVVAGSSVVFGDLEGQVHFLSAADGTTVQRLPTDGKPVVGTPVLSGTTVLVATKGGSVFAFRTP